MLKWKKGKDFIKPAFLFAKKPTFLFAKISTFLFAKKPTLLFTVYMFSIFPMIIIFNMVLYQLTLHPKLKI